MINKWIKISGLLIVLVLISFFSFRLKNSPTDSNLAESDSQNLSPAVNEPAPIIQRYRDGIYRAEGSYTSPAQPETISLEIVLHNDTVTAATFFENSTHPTSLLMQGKFKEGFAAEVVGRPLDEINLTVVNGSSLTPKGFMDALMKIKLAAGA